MEELNRANSFVIIERGFTRVSSNSRRRKRKDEHVFFQFAQIILSQGSSLKLYKMKSEGGSQLQQQMFFIGDSDLVAMIVAGSDEMTLASDSGIIRIIFSISLTTSAIEGRA
ncbi:hypothetical protein NE237_003431 [Protea cynaroides]|uniref:Uncharacterized protein n=1 Tax=Protea cynaroides TaxID=273540 RepID=A0A9Q0QSL6_9MAGN|nr:hypothetical protein NE237_003431 [Protea cynaroides]